MLCTISWDLVLVWIFLSFLIELHQLIHPRWIHILQMFPFWFQFKWISLLDRLSFWLLVLTLQQMLLLFYLFQYFLGWLHHLIGRFGLTLLKLTNMVFLCHKFKHLINWKVLSVVLRLINLLQVVLVINLHIFMTSIFILTSFNNCWLITGIRWLFILII